MLRVWTGELVRLREYDKIIKDFIWSGQDLGKKPRMDYEMILLPRDWEGPRLIATEAHTIGMVGKVILWIV